MMRAYNERRNRKVIVLVERKGVYPKQVARDLGITWGNVRQILHRWHRRNGRSVTKYNMTEIKEGATL